MNMKLTICTIMAMLTLGIAGGQAQEIEVPEDAPRETWQLVYDDYRSLYWGNTPEYTNLTKDVTVVRGDGCLYAQGIAKNSLDSWVKIGITDEILNNELLLWSNQPVTVSGSIQYINCGYVTIFGEGTTSGSYSYFDTHYLTEPLILSRDLTSDYIEYKTKDKCGFWLNNQPNRDIHHFMGHRYDGTEDTVFPEDENIYLNPRLIDKTAGIGGVNTTDDETDAPIYTLSGLKADRDNLTPGIYVSHGKKIAVK